MITTLSDVRRGIARPRLIELATIFEEIVSDAAFPCIYTHVPFTEGDLSFSHHRRGDEDLVESVVSELRALVEAAKHNVDAMLVIFIDDAGDGENPTLDGDRELAHTLVSGVLAAGSSAPGADGCPMSSAHPGWMLVLDDLGLFLNFSSPRHRRRRSRNVGPASTIIAQARVSFDQGGRSLPTVRDVIRGRIGDYDDVPPHPALGTFGDPSNRESMQYFLGDDTEAHDITVPAVPAAAARTRSGHEHPG